MSRSNLDMGEQAVDVFCDGSLTNSVLSDVFTSTVGKEYVGRAMILVPAGDIGLVTQTRDGMLDAAWQPCLHRSRGLCHPRSVGPLRRQRSHERHRLLRLPRSGATLWSASGGVAQPARVRLPNDFFDKVLRRASYLRSSSRTVSRRLPPQPHQIEAFELFNAVHLEFRLSESALWERICRDAVRHPSSAGHVISSTHRIRCRWGDDDGGAGVPDRRVGGAVREPTRSALRDAAPMLLIPAVSADPSAVIRTPIPGQIARNVGWRDEAIELVGSGADTYR